MIKLTKIERASQNKAKKERKSLILEIVSLILETESKNFGKYLLNNLKSTQKNYVWKYSMLQEAKIAKFFSAKFAVFDTLTHDSFFPFQP